MNCIVEEIERRQCELVLILDFLRRFLESGQHGTLTAGQMLSGITVLADLGKYLLHDDELIRYEWEVPCKLSRTIKAFNIQNRITGRIIKTEQISQHRIVLIIYLFQLRCYLILLSEDTFLNHFIRRGRCQGKPGLESRLDTRELILSGLDDLIDCFLSGTYHPDLSVALASDLLHKRLQVHQQINAVAHILANLIDHKQQSEVFRLGIHIFLHLGYKLSNGSLNGLRAVKPVMGSGLAHAQHFNKSIYHIILEECEGITGFYPR